MQADDRSLVVIGASAGGISALLEISRGLPPSFPAPVAIVQHVGGHPSLLPELLRYHGSNPAVHPEEGQHLAPGTLHVAPPDHHMLVDGDRLRLTRGPKENHARPAIDPLFRTAALSWGSRVIGVILTGQLDDGVAGLKAIKDCGGIAVVQDPSTAVESEMPRSALANVAVDHCVPLDGIAPLLVRLTAGGRATLPHAPPEGLIREVAINRGGIDMENLTAIADPSPLTCPDCSGALFEIRDTQPLRYRCHTGHAFTALSLARAQADMAESSVWNGVRALREREMLLRRLANIATVAGDPAQAAAGHAQADRLRQQVFDLIRLAEGAEVGPPAERDA